MAAKNRVVEELKSALGVAREEIASLRKALGEREEENRRLRKRLEVNEQMEFAGDRIKEFKNNVCRES